MKKTLRHVLLALVPCLSGCLFGSESNIDYQGRHVTEQQLQQLPPGTPAAEVLALLGEPSERTDLGDGRSMWSWRYTRREKQATQVLLLLALKSEETWQGVVVAKLADGILESISRTES